MSREGNFLDDVAIENFFWLLKKKLLYYTTFFVLCRHLSQRWCNFVDKIIKDGTLGGVSRSCEIWRSPQEFLPKVWRLTQFFLLLRVGMAAAVTVVTVLAVLWCDSRYKESRLTVQMQDYLCHSGISADINSTSLDEWKEEETQAAMLAETGKKKNLLVSGRRKKGNSGYGTTDHAVTIIK